ncbi:MAG TPA: copper chaperone PCu(A)C [Burkholderiaceae bacterium]|nr:copper chaperone PCu(A)C [Burkholderiaceae bacterium]
MNPALSWSLAWGGRPGLTLQTNGAGKMGVFRQAALAAALAFAVTGAWAKDFTAGDIVIKKPWSRATVQGMANGVSYFELHNHGDEDDRLVDVASPVSGKAELHTHEKDGDVMRMRQVPHIEVPAQGQAVLEPGGYHVMLMKLHEPLEQDSSFPLTLTFEHAGEVTVDVHVERMMKSRAEHDHDDHDHDEHDHH